MPAASPPDGGPAVADGAPRVIVCALSGRALAAAAVRAGYRPIVVDAFADEDTRALATACHRVGLDGRGGLARRSLDRAAARLPAGVPVVYGSGFEGAPGRLAPLAAGRMLAGNPPDAVRAARCPESLFSTLLALGIPHPETRRGRPRDPAGWLVKRPGGSGGGHVRPASGPPPDGDVLYQRHVAGSPLSAQVLGHGAQTRVLAFAEGWCAPAPGRPHRFGGVAGPVTPSPALADRVAAAAVAAVRAFGLRGLCSVDFVVDGTAAWLLEINPRPGAALDALAGDPFLFARHLAAFGLAPEPPPPAATLPPGAVAVVYAPRPLTVPPGLVWPAWCADRPAAGTAVPAGAPLCTVTAATAEGARRRATHLLSAVDRRPVEPAAHGWRPTAAERCHVPHPDP